MYSEGFVKYPSIPYLDQNPDVADREVKVYEKLDGANCQFFMDEDGHIAAGSRSGAIEDAEAPWYSWKQNYRRWVEEELSSKLYERFSNRVSEKEFPDNVLDSKYVFFGEWLHTHTKSYPERFRDDFYLIDVFDRDSERFVDYEDAKKIADFYELDVGVFRLLHEGSVDMDDIKVLMEGSSFGVERKEGVVLKDYSGDDFLEQAENFAKYVEPEFSEMRDRIGYAESNLIDFEAEVFVEECLDEYRQLLKEESGWEGAKKISGKMFRDGNISGEASQKAFFDPVYARRLRQALKIKVSERL